MPLQTAVSEVVADLTLLAQDRGITITATVPPDALVDGDPLRVRQILLNLTSNAIKYNHDGGWVRIAARPLADGRIGVSVIDGGVGMTPEELAGLFQPYRRAGSTERRIRGVGLGLVIVKKLVEAHGGTVTVESRPGEGSAFTFTLARGDPTRPAMPAGPVAAPAH
jgi:signal transduction histidine kinase